MNQNTEVLLSNTDELRAHWSMKLRLLFPRRQIALCLPTFNFVCCFYCPVNLIRVFCDSMQFPVILGILNNPLASANFQVTKIGGLILSNKTNVLLALGFWNPVVNGLCFWNYWARDIVLECLCSLQAESLSCGCSKSRELCLLVCSLFHIADIKLLVTVLSCLQRLGEVLIVCFTGGWRGCTS